MSYSKMVLEQIKYKEKLELIEQYRSQRPGYQNILDDAKRLHEQSSTASSMTLPTKSMLDAYAANFGSGGEIARRRQQAASYENPDNRQMQSVVRGMAKDLEGVENLSADDVFDYERGLGGDLYQKSGENYRKSIEFGNELRKAIPSKKRAEFDSEFGTKVPGVAVKLDDVENVFHAIDTVDSSGNEEQAFERGSDLIRKAARASVNAATADRDSSVQSNLDKYGVTSNLSPQEQAKLAQNLGVVASVKAMSASPNEYVRKFAKAQMNSGGFKSREAETAPYIKQKAPNVINNLLSLGKEVDTSDSALAGYQSTVSDAINKYVPKQKQKKISTSFNDKIVSPNVEVVSDYVKKNAPNKLTRGSSEYGYRETLRRMGKYQ